MLKFPLIQVDLVLNTGCGVVSADDTVCSGGMRVLAIVEFCAQKQTRLTCRFFVLSDTDSDSMLEQYRRLSFLFLLERNADSQSSFVLVDSDASRLLSDHLNLLG